MSQSDIGDKNHLALLCRPGYMTIGRVGRAEANSTLMAMGNNRYHLRVPNPETKPAIYGLVLGLNNKILSSPMIVDFARTFLGFHQQEGCRHV
ncbi:MAG: hypothetical protein LBU69_01220 [Deltaproteobacteria bacterium]|jgi:hypothetical protein|nr:hypothetical protein [Deltaproteobacteria bacterium]